MKLNFKIEGGKELQRNLTALPKQVERKVVMGALRKAAKPLIAEARARVPVKTGRLRASIGVRAARIRGGLAVHIGAGARKVRGRQIRHGHLIEFGTRHHAAFPFLRPAFEDVREEMTRVLGRELGRGIETEATKLGRR